MPKPLLPASVEHPTIGGFLKTIVRSALLDEAQLRAVLQTVPAEARADPQTLADHLIKTGKLSRFQARKLLQGAALGLVLGPFQVLAPIGKGGQSTVYLARDSRTQQLLALKVLPPSRAREEDRRLARFRREMDICQRVAHPHLAATHEVGLCQGVYYIAMEFIPGQSLWRLVNKQGPLAGSRAARLFAEVASGLEHAHERGLIHRDLKPSNILVTPNDHAKVLDLGLALIQGEGPTDRKVVGGQGYVVGSFDYMAPEQAEDATKVDARSDVYGLGCTLYFALTGRPPFPGGDVLQKLARHRSEEPVPITQLNPAVAVDFAALVHKMMAKRPEQRFASAGALREALLPWLPPEPALPLDKEGDNGYRDAMTALETEDVPTELSGEVIPVSSAVRRLGKQASGAALVTLYQAHSAAAEGTLPESRARRWPVIVGALFLALLALAGLVFLLWD